MSGVNRTFELSAFALSFTQYGPQQGPALQLDALATSLVRWTLTFNGQPWNVPVTGLALVVYGADSVEITRVPYLLGTGWTIENPSAGRVSFVLDGYDPAILAVNGRNPLAFSYGLVYKPDGVTETQIITGDLTLTPYFLVSPPSNVVPGTVWYNGTGAPSLAIGRVGDYYIDTLTANVYQRGTQAWAFLFQLTGQGGTPGAAGSKWYTGTGVPASILGLNGDLYLDSATGFYYLKSANLWAAQGQLTGPAGAAGSQWRTGSGTPAPSLGSVNDMYLDVLSNNYWQKQSGGWVLVGSLVGGLSLQRYSLTVQFDGSGNVSSVTSVLPSGWTAAVSGGSLNVTHTVGHAPVLITYLGLSGTQLNYRYPTAASAMTCQVSTQATAFSLALSSSVAGASAGSTALITLLF